VTTAVDTNVLIDLLFPSTAHRESSGIRLAQASRAGGLIIGEVVFAELAGYFGDEERLQAFLNAVGVQMETSSRATLVAAGVAWLEYTRRRRLAVVCPECGVQQDLRCASCGRELRPRQHLVADLMSGAHALHHADRLLTRDRGFYATYFPDLTLM